ncbi:DUF47 domain-containing protein [Pseudomonas sp. N040]|uniref:DUF47 domain-containing protein n=1 Tax=Pseudomonas sp. N040 TaxID=2785325 RepID=UPI0018A2DF26|nr:DUF47 family protein [Pseudomonas sp. N040]MBF7729626.1 DUF47 family protein [Pseudomonas sp. N040]MBW7013266.1 DUF47 family protein [Pseudomonas sp. N040]
MKFLLFRNPGHSLIARVFERVLPKAPDFFHMLSRQSQKVAETVELLVLFMQTSSREVEAQIHADEHTADDIKVANIHILNEAFSTPIDREDIYRAITNLDEVVNYCKDTVNEMAALGVKPDRFTLEMAQLLLVGAGALRDGFAKLGKKHMAAASDDAEVARKAERAIDHLYKDALADLFQGDNYIQMFKKREIYRHLTNAAERMAHCASTLHDIVVKMV